MISKKFESTELRSEIKTKGQRIQASPPEADPAPPEKDQKDKEAKGLRVRLAGTENELIVRIPLILGIGPVVVQPQVVTIAIELEDVRVATGVRFCVMRHPYHCPSSLRLGCILFGSKTPPARHTKSFLF